MAVRTIVVGAGGISGAWFPALIAEGVEISSVVDTRFDAAQARIAEFSLPSRATTDLHASISQDKPDFVLDLTIPSAHCEVTCTSLEMGCHVLGEKPIASSMNEARKMVETSLKTGKMYMIDQSRRWETPNLSAKEFIGSGTIGQVTTINCDFFLGAHFGGFRDEMESPLILDMSIHHFDLARYITGLDPVSVYAREFNPKGSWYKGDVSANCIFEMEGGVYFCYRGSWCSEGFHTGWGGDWRIIGDNGTFLYEKDSILKAQKIKSRSGFNSEMDDVDVPEVIPPAPTMHGALKEMLEYIKTGKRPQTECTDNIKSLAMVFAAIESSKTGEKVRITW